MLVVKLIAETKEENVILAGLSSLMADLGISVVEYRTDESFALTLWSVYEFMHICSEDMCLSYEDTVAFLEKIEPQLQAHTASAGARFLSNAIRRHAQKPHFPSAE